MKNILEENLSPYEGKEKVFTLNGKELIVPARLDTFLTYRTQFKEVAKACSDKAKEEYISSVNNLDTFMEHFPNIYGDNLNIILEQINNILIAEGIYQYSVDILFDKQLELSHGAVDVYGTVKETIEETQQSKAELTKGLANGLTSLLGLNNNTITSSFMDFEGDKAAAEVSKLTEEEKETIYDKITAHYLFEGVFVDYWNSFVLLVNILKENGKDIWLADSGEMENADAIIKNVTNPNFPQDKVIDVLFECILKNPKFQLTFETMEKKFGLTEEVKAIFDYFLYPEKNSVYSEEEFPKQEKAIALEQTQPTDTNEQTYNQNTTSEPQTAPQKKGFFSSLKEEVKKMDGEKVKDSLKLGAAIGVAGALFGGLSKGNSSQSSSNGKYKDLMGSSSCMYGKKSGGFTVGCDMRCPVYRYCSRGAGSGR